MWRGRVVGQAEVRGVEQRKQRIRATATTGQAANYPTVEHQQQISESIAKGVAALTGVGASGGQHTRAAAKGAC